MGHRARTLAAAVAAIIGIAFAAATGARASSLVRVETPAQSASFNALVNRVVASPSGPVQVIDATSGRPAQCDQASPIAALAAVVPQTDVAYSVAEDGTVGITAIKGTSSAVAPPAAPTWSWAAMADERTVADLCHGTVPEGTEVLVLPRCASPTPVSQPKCFTQGALYVEGSRQYLADEDATRRNVLRGLASLRRQPQARVAQRARDPDVVARPRGVAPQGPAGHDFAEDRDADVQRPLGGVAAHQVAAVGVGQREQPARKTVEPGRVGGGQGQRQGKTEGYGAHRRQVGQVHRQRLVPQQERVGAGKEMAVLDQHVG